MNDSADVVELQCVILNDANFCYCTVFFIIEFVTFFVTVLFILNLVGASLGTFCEFGVTKRCYNQTTKS